MPAVLEDLVTSIRGRHAGLAVALVTDGATETLLDTGADEFDEDTLFEIGSITKTMTATLLAVLIGDGLLSLETTVGEVLGADAGRVAGVTLLEVATHTAGLPRLAPNHGGGEDPADPYAHFEVPELREALATVELRTDGGEDYSNFGYQLLGHVLSVAAGGPYDRLVIDRVLLPAGCVRPRCGNDEPGDRRVPGYDGDRHTPRWRQPLAGAGGVELGIGDLARWVAANLSPDTTELADAVRLAQGPHRGDRRSGRGLGWRHMNGGLLHNGGTGGFRSICAFVPGIAGNAVLANLGGWDAIDGAAIRHLTQVVRAKAAR